MQESHQSLLLGRRKIGANRLTVRAAQLRAEVGVILNSGAVVLHYLLEGRKAPIVHKGSAIAEVAKGRNLEQPILSCVAICAAHSSVGSCCVKAIVSGT